MTRRVRRNAFDLAFIALMLAVIVAWLWLLVWLVGLVL
jgi:hypothetical protein